MKRKRYKLILLCAPLAMLLGLCLYLNLSGGKPIHIPCISLEFARIECPGCGATRCVSSILCFRFVAAFKYNALVLFLSFFFGGLYLLNIYFVIRYDRFIKLPAAILYATGAALVVFGIIRNLPFYPYDLENITWGVMF